MVLIWAIEMAVNWEEFEVSELEHYSVFFPVDVMDTYLVHAWAAWTANRLVAWMATKRAGAKDIGRPVESKAG